LCTAIHDGNDAAKKALTPTACIGHDASVRFDGNTAMAKWRYLVASWVAAVSVFAQEPLPFAQDQDKPAVAAQPRTVNLTQEQRFVIKENVKDFSLPKAPANAPETIGDVVPQGIELHALPPQAATKVAQARAHLFFVKEGDNAIVLVSPTDRRVADVIH
jgi:hypothetical protein